MVIYKITNLLNGKIYVGQKALSLERFLKSNYYGSGKLIKNSIEKRGIKNFKREVLDVVNSKKELDEREIYWIAALNTRFPNGYNLTDGGGGSLGHKFKMSDETKKKISEANKGKTYGPQSQETIEQRVSHFRGKKRSQETIDKIAAANRGKKRTDEQRKQFSEAHIGIPNNWLGRKHSDEAKIKMSESHKGKESHRKGKTHSEESKIKMSLAVKGKTKGKPKPPRTPEHLLKIGIGKRKNYFYKKINTLEKRIITFEQYLIEKIDTINIHQKSREYIIILEGEFINNYDLGTLIIDYISEIIYFKKCD